ncbi:MAG TPA: hypothetical protein VIJ08_01900 [Acidimicrobiales bacterium]
MSDWFVAALAESVQLPGPRSGTSTDSNPGPSVPESAPLIAFAFDIGATGFAVEVVTFEELLTTDDVVFVTFAVTITGVDVVVGVLFGVLVVGWVDVVTVGACVVTGDVEEGGRDETSGPLGVEAVRVKTRTSNRSGLDHISKWALFSEKGERGIVFVG